MKIIFTVTNDLNFDQRMIRICTTLSKAGHEVELVGVQRKNSTGLSARPYKQRRLSLLFEKGIGFYVSYNLQLFFFLLASRCDLICCIDMDTMLPVYFASVLRRKKRVYDAHEYFSQQKEIISRPRIYKVWHWLEKTFVPKFPLGYTVNQSIATIFRDRYHVDYAVIRNLPTITELPEVSNKKRKIIYQGSVNEGRGFEQLIPAMKKVDAVLDIYGKGNFFEKTKELVRENRLEDKVFLKGYVAPEELKKITPQYYIGVTLFENYGLNQYLSLANRFFDYIQSAVPQVTMNYPEYKILNDEFHVSVMLGSLEEEEIAMSLNRLLGDDVLYEQLVENCKKARMVLNWEKEEGKLIQFYKRLQ